MHCVIGLKEKIHDLELTRTISLQMAPQIRLVQSNDTVMSEKIQSTLVNTIPLWKSQMVLAIGVGKFFSCGKGLKREVTDMTNELLEDCGKSQTCYGGDCGKSRAGHCRHRDAESNQ